MKVRRVVTGHTSNGKAIIVSDKVVDPITLSLLPQAEFHTLWGADELPTFPNNGGARLPSTYYPPVGGFRFGLFSVPPQSVAFPEDLDLETANAELELKLPGLAAWFERDTPGMHTTNTVDFEYVISGEVWLELDDGKEVHLKAGDTVVQNGTRHAWRNKSSEPCRLIFFMIGAHRAKQV